nr:hypothetical protein Iba_chr08dCG14860 [Ipomoea batatas]
MAAKPVLIRVAPPRYGSDICPPTRKGRQTSTSTGFLH